MMAPDLERLASTAWPIASWAGSRIGVAAIRQFGGGATEPQHATLGVLKQALELAGVEFIDKNDDGPGVRLWKGHRKKA
jgi:hypothetical protein